MDENSDDHTCLLGEEVGIWHLSFRISYKFIFYKILISILDKILAT